MIHSFIKMLPPIALFFAFSYLGFADEEVHLTHGEATRLALSKPQPAYPPMAKQLHLEGEVKVDASIGEDGSVEDVHPISGNAVLTGAAVSAMKRWKFQPVMVQGKAVKAIATISFVFKM